MSKRLEHSTRFPSSESLTRLHSLRSRSTPLNSLEPIMVRFIEMCVEQRKGKLAKEGMHQYKNIAQNTSVTTIEVRIRAEEVS